MLSRRRWRRKRNFAHGPGTNAQRRGRDCKRNAAGRDPNENTNGLIRRLYPKGSSFAEMGKVELRRIDRYLNDRPRKCLGWKTPRETMLAFLASAP
jgi:IS30 family transposase